MPNIDLKKSEYSISTKNGSRKAFIVLILNKENKAENRF